MKSNQPSAPPMPDFVVNCPHCLDPVIIAEINCAIFRHGSYKTTGEQLNPHLCREKCDELAATNQINGCGKPFRLITKDGAMVAEKCEYI